MQNNTANIGDLNGRWRMLFKMNLALLPFLVGLNVWFATNIVALRVWQAEMIQWKGDASQFAAAMSEWKSVGGRFTAAQGARLTARVDALTLGLKHPDYERRLDSLERGMLSLQDVIRTLSADVRALVVMTERRNP